MKDKVIVALDVPTFDEAQKLIDDLGDVITTFKVGHQLFTAYGPFVVRYLQAKGKRVFLDLKFHDIPNTVGNAVRSAIHLSMPAGHDPMNEDGSKSAIYQPLFMTNVHTSGGTMMMEYAAQAAREEAEKLGVPRPLVIGVTVLTSDVDDGHVAQKVLERARLAQESGLDGVVASSQETEMLRREMGKNFVIVTPGIRPAGADAGDQQRIATPANALAWGSSYLVIGRPIVQAKNPREAAECILEEMRD